MTFTHLATWPWRRTVREMRRWRSHIYGWRQPGWWPERIGPWPGPRCPHHNQRVVIFVGSGRYEFAPAVSGRHSGHVYHGTIRPDATDIAARLDRLGLPTAAAPALAVISGFEGGFDALQTWDRGTFSWGFIQFTVTGGLARLLQEVKTITPDLFDTHFRRGGIDVDEGLITVQAQGRTLVGRAAHHWLHDEPTFWTPFLRASQVSDVQDLQVRSAYEHYYAHPLKAIVWLRGRQVTLGTLFEHSEYGRALVCDRSVNRGVGYALHLLRRAIRWSGARDVRDAPAVLDAVRTIEVRDRSRLDALAAAFSRNG